MTTFNDLASPHLMNDGSTPINNQISGKKTTIEDKYRSFISGQTQMKFAGAATSALMNQSMLSNRIDGGDSTGVPADVKKTFVYNQKLTSDLF